MTYVWNDFINRYGKDLFQLTITELLECFFLYSANGEGGSDTFFVKKGFTVSSKGRQLSEIQAYKNCIKSNNTTWSKEN